ncbi:MAG: response regulator, partial [Chitinophagaceae bacterium]|nr:response regulator [Chitinophagaceae bacterium]
DGAQRRTQFMTHIGYAVKFTKQGSIHINVDADTVNSKEILLNVSVTDTGIGIEKEKLNSIFDRFQQAEDSITRKYGGTGLGLSIVKDLVDLQKGKITVISEPGLGTKFQFSIPYHIAALTEPQARKQGTVNMKLPSHGIRILVVEDNEINQSLMKKLLGSWMIDPVVVSNGAEAIAQLSKNEFSIVLMDIQMPEMDGYSATKVIRDELRLSIPIIAMTAHALAGEREKCLAAGMDEYIAKPVREQELQQMISRFSTLVNDRDQIKSYSADDKYKYIDLSYMKEISGGDIDYERTVTLQFLEIVPADLEKMTDALNEKNFSLLGKLAHSMKASIAVMGMNTAIEHELDTIETGDNEAEKHVAFTRFADYCRNALKEVQDFNAIINR